MRRDAPAFPWKYPQGIRFGLPAAERRPAQALFTLRRIFSTRSLKIQPQRQCMPSCLDVDGAVDVSDVREVLAAYAQGAVGG